MVDQARWLFLDLMRPEALEFLRVAGPVAGFVLLATRVATLRLLLSVLDVVIWLLGASCRLYS